MRIIVLDTTAAGGQAGTSSRIENYLGFPSGISGAELADRALIQAQKFGARFAVPGRGHAPSSRTMATTGRARRRDHPDQRPVVIATGVRYRRLDVPRAGLLRADEHLLRGVAGGGPGLRRGPGGHRRRRQLGRAGRGLPLRARQRGHPHRPRTTTWASACPATSSTGSRGSRTCMSCRHRGPGTARRPGAGSRYRHRQPDRERRTIDARALFVFIGVTPCTGWLSGLVELDDHGFVRTGPDAPGRPKPSPELRPAGSARCSRPADPVSLLSAMSAAARPNGSPRPWARARWRSGSPSKEIRPT